MATDQESPAVDAPKFDEDFGNPTDASAPPWPSYGDPERITTATRLAAEAEQERLQAGVDGHTYTFGGHVSPGNQTADIVTEYGRVSKGQDLKLPTDAVEKLRAAGFIFNLVGEVPSEPKDTPAQAAPEAPVAAAEVADSEADAEESTTDGPKRKAR